MSDTTPEESETKPRVCAHCLSADALEDKSLCEPCSYLPRCEVCEVFFDGLCLASEENPERCVSCLNFELLIKFNCVICEQDIPLYMSKNSKVLHYIVRGNACGSCNAASRTVGQDRREEIREADHQFVGYLAILKNLYDGGVIDAEQWRHAVRMNRHDVLSWSGIEDLKEEELPIIELEVIEESV